MHSETISGIKIILFSIISFEQPFGGIPVLSHPWKYWSSEGKIKKILTTEGMLVFRGEMLKAMIHLSLGRRISAD